MKVIGNYIGGGTMHHNSRWTGFNDGDTRGAGLWLYIPEFTAETIDAERWQHVGYVFPKDDGGEVFPNKLTGGKNSVAAYIKVSPKPDERDKIIAACKVAMDQQAQTIQNLRADYRDRAALAALTGILNGLRFGYEAEPADLSKLVYDYGDAMLAERERRLGVSPSTAQE